MLSIQGKTASVIELLSPRLREFTQVESYSSKRSQLARFFDMMWAIIKRRNRVSLVLIDAYSSRAFWYTYCASALCRLLRIPYIPILHGGNFPNRLQRSPHACRFIFAHSAVNISPSFYLQKHFGNANFHVLYIPNFIEIQNYPYTVRNNFQPRLLWVRSFHQLYNPLLAVEVLASLKEQFPSATLCMVGPDKDGSLAKAKQRAIDLQVEQSVTFPGLLTKGEWIAMSRKFDVFINTTNFDNMPVSVIEAMALGLPIVSTNVGGLPYLVNDKIDGMLVPPCLVNQFSAAIEKILSDASLGKSLAVAARQKALQFDWKIVNPQWQEVINRYQLKKS